MEVAEAGGVVCGEGCSSMEKRESKDERLRVKRRALRAVLEECQRALQLLSNDADVIDDDDDNNNDNDETNNNNNRLLTSAAGGGGREKEEEEEDDDDEQQLSAAEQTDRETDELCELLKSRFECADFLQKLECARASVPQNITEEGNSWDMVNEKDLWEGEGTDLDEEDYVLVRQEDIVDGIACFMAAYLLSLKQTKDLTPNQLQEALSKTFSTKKKKGKLRKAWEGSKVIYNVASWSATAIGIYQNPVILRVASKAFWTSCHVISKLL